MPPPIETVQSVAEIIRTSAGVKRDEMHVLQDVSNKAGSMVFGHFSHHTMSTERKMSAGQS